MAFLSLPIADRPKVEMLERYLDIMCEKETGRVVMVTPRVSQSPQWHQSLHLLQSPQSLSSIHSSQLLQLPQSYNEEISSSIFELSENYPETPIIPIEFTRFSELHEKARCKIWHFARPEARHVKIQ
ncbi:hypothetical protein EYC80_005375 [Monilinia laxa]|uniref:Uncharacterized protein n=1 Tax=Monilinia laxa TaxID=61186 RepID=A0A5N6KK28_MONLA|nr:hypothetical protein EYC80_005375 [Monilinia laxa]